MDKIWLKSYKAAITPEITQDASTLIDWFETACSKYANNRAVTCHNETLTFSQIRVKVLHMAAALAELGVKRGDRVALILPNSIQYPLSVFAILALGASVVNINPLYTAVEMAYIIQNSEPRVIIVLDMFAAKLNDIPEECGVEHIIMSKIADPYPLFKRTLINLLLRYIGRVNPKLSYQPLDWRQLYNHPKALKQYPQISCDDMAFLQYTGATTGKPKGAMLLHRNIVANVRQVFAMIEAQVPDMDKQVVISALPLYHIFSLTANLFTFFLHGSENVMIPNAKNLKDLVKTMNNTPFTIFNSLDTLYHKLLEYPPFLNATHSAYKYGICGGMATRLSVAEAWHKQTGLYPTNCYGLTETSPCVTMSFFDEPFSGSVGYPAPSTELDIRDIETGLRSLGAGAVGIICIRGPQIMSGYWRNVEQTQKTLSADGWLTTGDIGYVNERGQLFICGRATEMIIVSGFNVYPAELEQAIDQLPEIREVAVVGYPDEDTGEAVHAFIVFAAGAQLSNEQIISHCRKSLTKYKLPKTLTTLKELPKTPVGKIDKKVLVAEYLSSGQVSLAK